MSPQARPILLIGGDGQIGWELRRTLAPLGALRDVGRPALDLAQADSIRRAVRETAPAVIVNAGAYTMVDKAEREEAEALAVNGHAPGILAEEARRLGALLVHYSTDYVFDGKASRPYREDDPPNPINAYGRGKLAGERAIAAVGADHVILRTSWVYSLRRANFLLTIRRLARREKELRVVADQIGAPTWARPIAEATAAIVARWFGDPDRETFARASGVYHLAAAGKTNWHGFAEAIVAAMRASGEAVSVSRVVPITSADYAAPAARPANSLLDCAKVGDVFGIGLPDWREQLAQCLRTGNSS